MTIELITGAPGAGKTTYAVAERLVAESTKQIPLEPESCMALGVELGTIVPRRLCVAGVKGLVLEHERLPHTLTGERIKVDDIERWNAVDKDGEPLCKRLPTDPPITEVWDDKLQKLVPLECSLFNWWMWCKPGDLIFVDEVQYIVPRGTLGKKPPPYIALLEIHRHYGVDFLLVTQHPQLIDPTIRALVGLHRHVRSVMGSPICMVYVWDHASNPERYQLANKAGWRRRRKYYALFRSSVAHVKPPAAGRWGVVAAPVLLFVGLGGLGWKLYAMGKPAQAGQAVAAVQPVAPGRPGQVAPARPSRPVGFVDVPELQGCYAWGDRCACQDRNGRPVRVALDMCRLSAGSFDGLVAWEPRKAVDSGSTARYGAAAGAPAPGASSPGVAVRL